MGGLERESAAVLVRETVGTDVAPDILMVPNEGYSLTHAKSAIEDADCASDCAPLHWLAWNDAHAVATAAPMDTPPTAIAPSRAASSSASSHWSASAARRRSSDVIVGSADPAAAWWAPTHRSHRSS